MANRFRISANDTIKACLFNSKGKLLTTLYDSGYTTLNSVKDALLRKCCNPPLNTTFSVDNTDKQTYWSNR